MVHLFFSLYIEKSRILQSTCKSRRRHISNQIPQLKILLKTTHKKEYLIMFMYKYNEVLKSKC